MAREGKPGFFHRYIGLPFETLILQGSSTRQLALAVAIGVTFGVFPIMGASIPCCFVAALILRAPQPLTHAVNYAVYPLQIPLLLVFIRLGEKIVGARPVPFSITDMLQRFKDSPAQFFRDFGLTGLHGIGGWLLVAPLVAAILYFALRPVLRKMAQVKIG